MFKYILLISFAVLISCSNSNNKENIKRVEIILTDEDFRENIEVKEYDEDKLKNLALSSLKEFYSLPYTQDSVRIAYEKFYSTNYKEVLRKSRNIKNADEYVQSDPSLDFEFETKIEKVYDIKLEGQKAYIDADSSVYDRVEDTTSKARQTFVMSYENNKWVIL
ncbi:hypothetical protein [Brachyspira hyodysenteriae]|uniref:hypothetical protein n=1 Tax=Brachyspira hyodysenteriae TaxID=159 RepID=UPI00063DD5A3|nr:hypothetical protein [Brachyspira hyodysenteriae]KLI48529.1 hypothetical protein SZ41_06990 [Brachyspira hyodysenteriae]KLI55364.1 hypothetical protein SZ43_01570 [Brachyspira hyodysenteriae]MCZ9955793.1 hypothetical protein [Brachyspira hyodysenteriae]MDA0054309.1 hypothetical protein [Brachyspira hyodysenteriae]TVL65848.1 hypothetical protein A9X75_10830 [Brachyspira hyodysenteriae]